MVSLDKEQYEDSMLKQFFHVLASQELVFFLKTVLTQMKVPDFPFSTYFGINYKGNSIETVKFYFVCFKKINEYSLLSLFPFMNSRISIYRKYKESNTFDFENLGFTIGVKVDKLGKLYYSYYQQEEGFKNPPLNAMSIPFTDFSIRDNLRVIESEDGSVFDKNYYLIVDKCNIELALNCFGIKNLVQSQVQYIEYVEYGDKKKMVMGVPDYQDLINYINGNNNLFLNHFVSYLRVNFGILPYFPGSYLSSELKSLYFFKKGELDDFLTCSDTLETLLH